MYSWGIQVSECKTAATSLCWDWFCGHHIGDTINNMHNSNAHKNISIRPMSHRHIN